jgi:hypothetical protein
VFLAEVAFESVFKLASEAFRINAYTQATRWFECKFSRVCVARLGSLRCNLSLIPMVAVAADR